MMCVVQSRRNIRQAVLEFLMGMSTLEVLGVRKRGNWEMFCHCAFVCGNAKLKNCIYAVPPLKRGKRN